MTDIKKPSEKLTLSYLNGAKVKDSLGRTITLKKPDILDEYYLSRAMGSDSENARCMALGYNTLFVQDIDGIAIPRALSEAQFLSNLSKVMNEGIEAISKFIIDNTKVENDNEVINQIKK